MSHSGTVTVTPGLIGRAVRRATRVAASAASRHVRLTVVAALLATGGSFASAGLLQLRWERGRALTQAGAFEQRRAGALASDIAGILNRYAALGSAFANASGAESSAALSDAGGTALSNVAMLDAGGAPLFQLKGPPGFLPLSPQTVIEARRGRAVIPAGDGHIALLFPHDGQIVAVEIDLAALLHGASMDEALLATEGGRVLSLGSHWPAPPSPGALDLDGHDAAIRGDGTGAERRLIALHRVAGWPLEAGASVRTGEALSSWYASLPLFLFFILGPSIAGAALAVIFVREFERRARAGDALRTLKAAGQAEAKLLIRLADAERRASEAERSKSEFVAHMSHELRTPLNAIIGFSEVIAGGYFGEPGHPKYIEYARDIALAGKHLHGKIGDVLEFANVEAGRHPITLTAIDAVAVAREVVDEFAGRAFSRRIRMSIALPDIGRARGDALAVKRVLSNLLSNALEYTPEGGAVQIMARNVEGAVAISIADTGQGFTRDEQALAGRAFTRFDRPGAVTGVGMGLAIAMALARAMGGVLRLAGAPGQGTVAELRLPRV